LEVHNYQWCPAQFDKNGQMLKGFHELRVDSCVRCKYVRRDADRSLYLEEKKDGDESKFMFWCEFNKTWFIHHKIVYPEGHHISYGIPSDCKFGESGDEYQIGD
jgi:hypothetical protein